MAALKVAWLLQTNGRLPLDTAPPLGEGEGAFCAIRAALMDELLQVAGPLWLKRRPSTGKKRQGQTLDELHYVEPTQEHIQAVLCAVQEHWVTHATNWWQTR